MPAPRVLIGVAASLLVLGLTVAATTVARGEPRPGPAGPPSAIAAPAVGVVVDPYTRAAATCRGLDPVVLVAIHDVETNRDAHGATSVKGAVGPMQFLPDTWNAYGVDANSDGTADVWNLDDALAGATRFLCVHGVTSPSNRDAALFEYNHSHAYVRRVVARIAELHGTRVS